MFKYSPYLTLACFNALLSLLNAYPYFFGTLCIQNKPYDKVLGAAQLTKRIKACKST